MEYIYAALILHKLKKEINESNITSIIKSTGVEANISKVKSLIASLSDIDIEKTINSSNAISGQIQTKNNTETKENKKENKAKEKEGGKSEEQAMEGLASLFG